MKKLRLLVTANCNRNCEGCCNKDWDLQNLPIETDFTKYKEVILTGGEPLFYPDKLMRLVNKIRNQGDSKIYIYTAMAKKDLTFIHMLNLVDGMTLTLHEQSDIFDFLYLQYGLSPRIVEGKSMRLNIFDNLNIRDSHISSYWQVKKDIQWIKNCPLPENEVFMRDIDAFHS